MGYMARSKHIQIIMEPVKKATSTVSGFKQFILRGNVVDLAVGVVFGASFVNLLNAIVKDLITPAIAAIATQPDFSSLKVTVNGSQILYGDFLNAFISFFLIALVAYFVIVVPTNALIARTRKDPPADPTTKTCPECKSEIPVEATRCKYCAQVVS
jgi:large conductance mechanosensitive channel